MKLECYIHLPAVQLEELEQFKLCDGILTHMPFDFWYRLDSTFFYAAKHYERTRPVFYYMQVDCHEDEADRWLQCFQITLRDLHLSLLLQPGHYLLPHPLQSCRYYLRDGQPLRPLVGPMNREWIIYGNPWSYYYDSAQLQLVAQVFDFLSDFSDLHQFPDLVSAIAVLQETTAVEYAFEQRRGPDESDLDYRSGFIRCMALLEDILFPKDRSQRFGLSLTKAFGTYLALLVNLDLSQFTVVAERLSYLYKVRSQLVHGELNEDAVIESKATDFMFGRQMMSRAIQGMMRLYKSGYSREPLKEILSACLVSRGKDVLPEPSCIAKFHSVLFPRS